MNTVGEAVVAFLVLSVCFLVACAALFGAVWLFARIGLVCAV